MSDEKQEPLTAEEMYLKHLGKATNVRSVYYKRYLDAMHEFSDQQTKVLKEQNHNLEVTCAVRHDTIQTNILIIDKLQSELAQVKEHNKQLAEALSQQEPIKMVDELKKEFIKECTQEVETFYKGLRRFKVSIEDVFNFFLPHLRTSNTQSDAVEFAQWINDNCQMQNSLPKDEWYYVDKDSKRNRLTSEELYAEFQNSKGIKQNNSVDIDYDITKEE